MGDTMRKIRLICKRCGCKFEKEVFEEGEAREKNLRSSPINCPECGGPVEKC